jgi:putative hydrolase of the HAD superfamily
VPTAAAFAVLRRALTDGRRHTAFQDLAARFNFSADISDSLVQVFRSHTPRLRLPRASAEVLHELRRDWTLGVLTNGHPEIQARKIAALGLSDMVDAVVYGQETGAGKPEPAAFAAILNRLHTARHDAVFVGDDPWCDIMGARRAGMKTIRLRRGVHGHALVAPGEEADATVDSLKEVPAAVARLLAPVACHVT